LLLILHLSDLHYSLEQRKDLTIVRDALLRDIRRMRLQFAKPPDLVVFSGDLVLRGQDPESYATVEQFFLAPISESTDCPLDRLILAPGNHDIDRTAIDRIVETGLSHELSSTEGVNRFLDDLEDYPLATARLLSFNAFIGGRPATYLLKRTPLWSTYQLPSEDGPIGVAALNSAWRATGQSDDLDREHLLLGERQVDDALATLGECPTKIAIFHHPMDWLADFDRKQTGRLIVSNFDLVFTGHVHESDPQQLQTIHGSAMLSQAGSLYAGRQYYNGYSWVSYDGSVGTVSVSLREYSDVRREFDKSTRLATDGLTTFPLPKVLATSRLPIRVADAIHAFNEVDFSKSLLSASPATKAPKDLKSIFVAPSLSTAPESAREVTDTRTERIQDTTRVSPEDLVRAADNLVIIGKPQYGRTTLLHWAAQQLSDSLDPSTLRATVYLEFNEIPKSSKVLARRIQAKLKEAAGNDAIDVESLMRSGECVVLIDDFDHTDVDRVDSVRTLMADYTKARWILSVEETLWLTLNPEIPLDLGVKYRTVYLRPFGRRQTKELVRRWLRVPAGEVDDTVDEVLNAMRRVAVPVTPFLISTVLAIVESGRQLSLVNYAAVLESLLEDFLQKAESSAASRGLVDYRNREHYLAQIAWRMVERGEYELDRADLEMESVEYFKRLGLRVAPSEVIEYMIERGVFIQRSGRVSFKYAAFAHLFIAKWMIEDRSALEKALTEDQYLLFAQEIDLVTGLQRNNATVLAVLRGHLDNAVEKAGGAIDVTLFDLIGSVGKEPLSEQARATLAKRFSQRPNAEERDEMLEEMDRPLQRTPPQTISRSSPRELMDRLMRTLVLYSQVVRNCELIGEATKSDAVGRAFDVWTQLMVALSLVLEEVVDDGTYRRWYSELRLGGKEAAGADRGEPEGGGTTEAPAESVASQAKSPEESGVTEEMFRDFIRLIGPSVVQNVMEDALGTPKLDAILEARLDRTAEALATRLMEVCLYCELRLPRHLEHVRSFVADYGRNRYAMEIMLVHMARYYLVRPLTKAATTDVERILTEIIGHLGKTGTRLIDADRKNAAITQLRKRKQVLDSKEDDR
jgi:Calcineurin-like phosphoesterase/NACHT domain